MDFGIFFTTVPISWVPVYPKAMRCEELFVRHDHPPPETKKIPSIRTILIIVDIVTASLYHFSQVLPFDIISHVGPK
jgi:hypothetical protein